MARITPARGFESDDLGCLDPLFVEVLPPQGGLNLMLHGVSGWGFHVLPPQGGLNLLL